MIRHRLIPLSILTLVSFACHTPSDKKQETALAVEPKQEYLFMDVHYIGPGKVTAEAVADAHKKDLATQGKYDVNFLKYWVDETKGNVYCLVESPDSASIAQTHKEAHGLIPDQVHEVSEGQAAALKADMPMFFDVHKLKPGSVKASDVAEAHKKDLAVQGKYHVNFVDYWVDEKNGVVMCVAEAPDSASMVNTHKEAHGLIPDEVHPVKQGN